MAIRATADGEEVEFRRTVAHSAASLAFVKEFSDHCIQIAHRGELAPFATQVADMAELADRQLVVEAVVEDEAMKVDIFRQLDRVVAAEDAILASNTSSIPIMKLGTATGRPEQVIGIHFFNPVPVLRLVELVTSLLTSAKTAQRAEQFAHGTLGKQVIRSQDAQSCWTSCSSEQRLPMTSAAESAEVM